MKFQCDRCKTRYSIGEEKIRGKVLKIRCKNCSAVITVREGQSSTGGADKEAKETAKASAAAGGTKGGQDQGQGGKTKGGKKQDKTGAGQKSDKADKADQNGKKAAASPVLEDAFNRAMSRLPTPDPAKNLDADEDAHAPGLLDTSDASSPGDEGPPLEIEWYVSIDGEQEGPFTLAQAQKRVSKKQPPEEMFAWQEGFDDWLPVEKVTELASHVPVPAPARNKRASAPPMPGDVQPPVGSGRGTGLGTGAGLAASTAPAAATSKGGKAKTGKGGKDKEAPVEDKPLSLAALAKEQAKANDVPDEPTGGDFDFDIGEASRVVKLPMLVPPPRGDAAATAGARGGLPGMTGVQKVPRGTGGVPIIAGGIIADDVNLSAAVLQPKKSSKHGLVFWVGGGAMVAILGVLMVILLKSGDSSGAVAEGENPSSAFIEGFYDPNSTYGVIPGLTPKAADPNAPATDKGKPTRPRPRPPGPIIAGTDPGGRRPNTENFDDPTVGSVSDRDAEEVLDAQKRFGAGLKWCYERALKTNPDLQGANNRYDVQITITAAGAVRSVSVAGKDKGLKDCLQGKVTTWNFKPARGDFTTAFPILFK